MELKDTELLKAIAVNNPEVKSLLDDHVLYEKKLEAFESKSYLTPAEEAEAKSIKKQKLDGKTRLVAILERHKQMES